MSIYEYNYEEHMRMEREDSYADGLQDGHQSGLQEGTEKMLQLIMSMTQDGLQESIPRLASDTEFYREMAEKYAHIREV